MSKLPSTGPSLQRYLRQQARTAQRQQQSSAFNLSGTSVVAEDVTEVDGTLNVVGNLNVSGPAVITGTLSLPAGIINNDALANPVLSQSVYGTVSNFTLAASHPIPAAISVIKTVTITVPAGFTSANVSVISRVFAYNNNTSGGIDALGSDYFFCQTGIAGTYDFALGVAVLGNGSSSVAISPFATTLSGLTPGSTFTITIGACSDYLNWTQTGNVATVSGNILWFR
jgi:hypothetical protein